MKRKTIVLISVLAAFTSAGAQTISSVLGSVERNNMALKAQRTDAVAAVEELKADNTLEGLSVEYSPFFRKGADGVASSELVVSQGFDFPTLYAARGKAARLRGDALYRQYAVARRDMLLAAKNLCLDLVCQAQTLELLATRQRNSEELLALFTKKMAAGEATAIEVNKIKMDLMGLKTEVAQAEAARQTALESLTALNGGGVPAVDSLAYEPSALPADSAALFAAAVASDRDVMAAEAAAAAEAQQLKVSRQGWIPKLEVGYRRNTDGSEASNGFLVGATIPLFSAARGTKAAKARHAGARLQAAEARIAAESRARSLLGELQKLRRARAAYDMDLMRQTLALLRRAVESGQISVTDYYVEADAVYTTMQAATLLERQYQGVLAEITRNSL